MSNYDLVSQERPQTLYGCAIQWLESVQARCKYSTYIKYSSIFHVHLQEHFQRMSIETLTGADALRTCTQILLAEYTKSADKPSLSTMEGMKNVCNQIFQYADLKLRLVMPQRIIADKKYAKREAVVLTKEEQERLTAYLCEDMDRYKMGILLCLYSGLRLGELCALTVSNVDLDRKTITVSQTVQRIKAKNDSGTVLHCSEPKSISSIREIPLCDRMIALFE